MDQPRAVMDEKYFRDVDSIFSFQTAASDIEFDFDDEIISSPAYRRAFLQVMRDPKQRQSNIVTMAPFDRLKP
jgi:hypothetical protein